MSKIGILIVENEPIIAADLERQLKKVGYEVLETLKSGDEVLLFLRKVRPDVILMDIQLDGALDGIDVAHEIEKHYDIPMIFLTSFTDDRTFTRAKLTQPHAFLSKPFRTSDIVHSIDLAVIGKETNVNLDLEGSTKILKDRIFIREKSYLSKVMIHEILFVEADSSYSKVVTSGKSYLISQTLKTLTKRFPNELIKRVHRSFMVNIDKVEYISDRYIHIGLHKIPIGRSYRDEIKSVFKSL